VDAIRRHKMTREYDLKFLLFVLTALHKHAKETKKKKQYVEKVFTLKILLKEISI